MASLPSPARAWYAVLVFMFASMYGQVLRFTISLLVVPIRHDLGISDTQFGLLTGMAFALFYVGAAVPISRISDRGSRRTIIAIGILTWSVMTGLCGLARNFGELLSARLGVGLGQSVMSPAAISALSDIFPREKLGRVFAVYGFGSVFGPGCAYLVGGAVLAAVSGQSSWNLPIFGMLQSWQLVFLIIAIPGLPLAALMFTVPEVRIATKASGAAVGAVGIIAHLKSSAKPFAFYCFAYACLNFLFYAFMIWLPALLLRRYHLEGAAAGGVLGIVMATVVPVGMFTGGTLSDWWTARGRFDSPILVGIIAYAGTAIFGTAMPLVNDWNLALVLLCCFWFFMSLISGVGYTGLQILTPPHLRAQVVAIYIFVTILIGMSIGPVSVPLLTDHVFKDPNAINRSISIVAGVISIAGFLSLVWGRKSFDEAARRQAALMP